MKRIVFDGLELINHSSGYYVGTPIGGLEAPTFDVATYNRSGEDGIVVSAIYSRERRISIPGLLKAACGSDLVALRRALASRCLPDRDSNQRIQAKTLRLIDYDDSDYTISVYVANITMDRTSPTDSRYLLDILAEDYAILSTTQKTATVTKSTGGALSIPFSIPFSFVGGTDGSETVTNSGDVATYPVITFTGQLTNPRLKNQTNGVFVQLNTTIEAGDTVVFDPKYKTAVKNGTTNVLGSMTSNSSYLYLDPGENQLVLTSGDDDDTGQATIVFQDAYSGI